ncbi:hypothetical protein AB8989_17650 [Yersinia hibernica]|uniref:Uncharacterized protein n=1 Tax=Yersinia hibernica TaxID=2339259 RepID=A0ABX5R4J9_9GAMM|nr:hypothetical protein [Yersinia hibernica]QAX80070.1 hypothetical protein D5F51_16860 [Yersinia hibernica]
MSHPQSIRFSVSNRIIQFNHLSNPSKQSDIKPAGTKFAHKLSGLSNTITPQPSAAKKITFHSILGTAEKNNTASKVSIVKTDNHEKALSRLDYVMINQMMSGLPPINGQTYAERFALALNQYQEMKNTIIRGFSREKMPPIPRNQATVLMPAAPKVAVNLNSNLKPGDIPPPPPLPSTLVAPAYERKTVMPASQQQLEQNAAEQRSKIAKKGTMNPLGKNKITESVIAELKQKQALRRSA